MTTALDPVIEHAIRAGILPHGAVPVVPVRRPWPIVVLSFFGAVLVALPFVGVAILPLERWIFYGSGGFVLGIGVLLGATALLRNPDLALFVEQLASTGLLLGATLLGIDMFDTFPEPAAAAALALVSLTVSYSVRRDWVRVVLGGSAATFAVLAITLESGSYYRYTEVGRNPTVYFIAMQIATGIWAALEFFYRPVTARAHHGERGIFLDRTLLGWAIALLIGLSVGAGNSFLVSETLSFSTVGGSLLDGSMRLALPHMVSYVAALLAVAVLIHTWRSLLVAWFAMPAAGTALLCFALPALGPCLLILCLAAAGGHRKLAVMAGAAGVWILGSFYYALRFPLAYKAGFLLAIACAFGAAAYWRLRAELHFTHSPLPVHQSRRPAAWQRGLLTIGCSAVLVVINIGIWQKQAFIASGRAVFIELAPVDPRSLMQGDFMALRFQLPAEHTFDQYPPALPVAIGAVDQRGIVTLQRIGDRSSVGKHELMIKLVRKDGRLQLPADAWYFQEGNARYGEFRVDREGTALLVGLRGPNLEAL